MALEADMGGFGSGGPSAATRRRCTVDQFYRVDVRVLAREGAIAAGSRELVIGPITLELSWTQPTYGGLRPWFVCECGRRAAVLYVTRGTLGCRRCLGLAYPSQRERRVETLYRQMMAAWARLEAVGGTSGRPKGMHRRTYVRLGLAVLKLRRAWLEEVETQIQSCRAGNLKWMQRDIARRRREEQAVRRSK